MASLRDVAERAGVSPSTVSLVLRQRPGSERITEATRLAVVEAASQVGYVPNVAARNLRARPSGHPGGVALTIALMWPLDARLPLMARLVGSLHATLSAEHRAVDLVVSTYTIRRLAESRPFARPQWLHGVVVANAAPEDERFLESLETPPLPLVLFHRDSRHNCVNADNRAAARQATDHLVRLGHRRIGLLVPDVPASVIAERVAGYRAALDAAGIPLDPALVERADFSEGGGVEAAGRLLDRRPRPTAIFALTDAMAIGAMHLAKRRSLRVPADLAVAGFEGVSHAAYVDPPLTTIRLPIEEMAAAAARILVDSILNPSAPPRRERFEARLIVRESCGASAPHPSPLAAPSETTGSDEGHPSPEE